ncbi:MAG: AMIN domain-containing protein [Deltaproteobacteria bacterium]|nr:AMIN domain-containing protein [Deltaproteobacteria bacterium]
MRCGRYYLGQGYIFLLLWFLGTFAYTPLSTATDPDVVKDVRVVHQDGQWHVVITGSESMIYKETKTIEPLQLVLNLPNTVLRPDALPRNPENEIIGRITGSISIDGPQLLTQIEIVLNRDVSHTISRVQEKIWVSFDTPPLLSRAEPTQIEPVVKSKAEDYRDKREAVVLGSPLEEKIVSIQPIKRKPVQPARNITAIKLVKTDEELRVYILADGSLADYVAFHLTSPPRLVLDFMKVKSAQVKSALNLKGPLAKKIRVGVHPDKLRVVFDLVSEKGLPYQVTLGNDRLVVSFKPGSGFPAQ